MDVKDANKIMLSARQVAKDEIEHQFQTAIDAIETAVSTAAKKGLGRVKVFFNTNPKVRGCARHWLGELSVIKWDGGERTEISEQCVELARRISTKGFQASIEFDGIDIIWENAGPGT
jgi:hypothetical protein